MEVVTGRPPELPEDVGHCPCGCNGTIRRTFVREERGVTNVTVRVFRYICSCGSEETCPRTWFHTPFAAGRG